MSEPINIIIPAHNEATVIGLCLQSLLDQTTTRPLRIIVITNGCTDATAHVVRRFQPAAQAAGHELIVEEPPCGCCKADALNHGDLSAAPGIRIYMDADVCLSHDAITGVIDELENGRTSLTAPALKVASARSLITRSYAQVWSRLPVVRNDVMGCGLYAVTARGRRRWDSFPRIISDDKFVRLSFTREERRPARKGSFTIYMPEGFTELIRVRGRWCRGNRELVEKFPHIGKRERNRYDRTLLFLFKSPSLWPHVPLFILVFILGQLAALRRRGESVKTWERADAARVRMASDSACVVPSNSYRRCPLWRRKRHG
jgi:cellulose synthase/poly-beta-1,6-N-acetylglucosamine synthase-like glycosyltransferase